MKTWTDPPRRIVNKPHIFKWKGEWRVALREGFEYQRFMYDLFEARRFIERLNMRLYESRWFDMTKTDAGKFNGTY